MRLLRVNVRYIIVASLTLLSILLLSCTVLDPRLLAVRSYLTPYSLGGTAQVRLWTPIPEFCPADVYKPCCMSHVSGCGNASCREPPPTLLL